MPVTIRKATPDDAPLLVRVVDTASGSVVPTLWAEMAPPGLDGSRAGLGLIMAEDGDFSYTNGFIAERDGTELGGLIGNVLPPTPQPISTDVPEVFVGVEALAQLVPGHWYINFMAALPDFRRQGVGTALLNEAEKQARGCSCPGLALIVAASNENAIRVYQKAGYAERARRPFDLSAFGEQPTEAVLMVKKLR
ncbi:GNAT family N-acetyltransferase [uncultured Tateyamaria sp.]|uniref:GNAT family N-acetyltransferase n=1 Tax=uncultured Tateyamaria sp. TaxID=455651 RepID=UPI002629783D|nr:GNAT family N-acetyltransferase [uncultured Tateyamaria sp.]